MLTLGYKPSENIMGKEENAGNQHFLLFATMFSSASMKNSAIYATLKLLPANVYSSDEFKILLFGKKLNERRTVGVWFVVFADCVDGDFGQDCRQSCHCEGNPCNKQNGICPSGKCLPGFTTQTCNRSEYFSLFQTYSFLPVYNLEF